jgi:hypothetical protein
MKRNLAFAFAFVPTSLFAQTGSDIFLVDMKISKASVSISNPVNITHHPGYDNQPFFHADQPVIYYSSFNDDGRADIRSYNYRTGETRAITQTQEREYSPTLTPDKKFLSCIIQRDSGAQDLGKYPVGGGEPIVLIDHLIIGYHAWIDQHRLILFILGKPPTLHVYDLAAGEDKVIAENTGRSLHKIPGKNAMSFVHEVSDKEWSIKKLDSNTLAVSVLAPTLPGREDLTWTRDGKIIMCDGENLFFNEPGKSNGWILIRIESGADMLKGVTRLAASPDGKKLALVVAEH